MGQIELGPELLLIPNVLAHDPPPILKNAEGKQAPAVHFDAYDLMGYPVLPQLTDAHCKVFYTEEAACPPRNLKVDFKFSGLSRSPGVQHTNLTAELYARVTEVLDEIFGEGRVEVTPHPGEYPPTVEFGNVWISPPDGDCEDYVWGTQHHHPGDHQNPPETDVKDWGSYKRMDDAIKPAVLQHTQDMLEDKFLSESGSDEDEN